MFSIRYTRSRFIPIFSSMVVLLFTGLRYQLGYDWIGYEKYFNMSPDHITFSPYWNDQLNLNAEISYYILNILIKSLGGNFEFLLFIISFFNIYILYKAFSEKDENVVVFCWMVYCIIGLLAIQFNIIRQSIATSFVILSLIYSMRERKILSYFFMVIAFTFHVSTIIFIPVLLTRNFVINRVAIVSTILALFVIFISGAFLFGDAISVISNYLPPSFFEKANSYVLTLDPGLSPGVSALTAGLIAAYIFMLFLFFPEREDRMVNLAFNLTVLILGAHLVFSQFPSLWNRIMAVSLAFQLPCVWHILRNKFSIQTFIPILLGVSCISLSVMYYQTSRAENIAFVPYHSLIQVWAFGDEGDGRQRSEYAIRQSQELQALGQ